MEKNIILVFANSIHKAHDKALGILSGREITKKTRYSIETEDTIIKMYEVSHNKGAFSGMRCNYIFIHDSLPLKTYRMIKDSVRMIGEDNNIYTFD